MRFTLPLRPVILSLLFAMVVSAFGLASGRERFELQAAAQVPFVSLLSKLELGRAFQFDGKDRIGELAYTREFPASVAEPHASLTLNSVADATVIQNLPVFDAGATTDMWAGYDSCLSPSVGIVRSLVAFNTGSIPSSNSVTSATLRLYLVTSCDSPGETMEITTHGIGANWTESGVNWANMPSFSGSYGFQSILHEEYKWYEFDVTELVQSWHDGRIPNYGIMITGPETSGFRGFSTKEGLFTPELIVDHVPNSESPTPTNTPIDTPTNTPTPPNTATPTNTPTPTRISTSTPLPTSMSAARIFLPAVQHGPNSGPSNTPTTMPEPTATTTPPTATAIPATDALFANILRVAQENGYANAPDHPTLDLGAGDGEDFTIETFFYVPRTMVDDDFNDLVVHKEEAYKLNISFNESNFDWIRFSLSNFPTGWVTLNYGQNLAPGWHHLAAVYDNEFSVTEDRYAIYLDGLRVADSLDESVHIDWTPGIHNSASELLVGGFPFGSAGFAGYLEEMRFSSTVRYNAPTYAVPNAPFVTDSDTRTLWHFDESAGSTHFADASTHGNALTGHDGAATFAPGR